MGQLKDATGSGLVADQAADSQTAKYAIRLHLGSAFLLNTLGVMPFFGNAPLTAAKWRRFRY